LGHAVIGRALPVTGIGQNIARPHRTPAAERWLEYGRVARNRKLLEGFARRTREGVEGVGLAIVAQDIIEKCPEGSVAEFDSRIGHELDELLEIMLGGDRDTGLIEKFKDAGLFPGLNDASFERFIQGEKARLQRLALRDVGDRASK